MKPSSLVRPVPVEPEAAEVGEPSIVAFRRQSDEPADAAATSDDPDEGHLPVLLRLPDLDEVAAPAPLSSGSNPLVGKIMWASTGLLALVAIGLLMTGKKSQPASNHEAPRWRSTGRKPTGAEGPAASAPKSAAAPTWKLPATARADAENRAEPSLWQGEAQLVQPQAPAEIDNSLPPDDPARRSASWPGDQPPLTTQPYRRAPGAPGAEAPVPQPYAPQPYAPQVSQPQAPTAPNPTSPAIPATPTGPATRPADGPATPAFDPWPGSPAWPADAQRRLPIQTAGRPAPNPAPPAVRPSEARLEGGIRTLDMSPHYDRARPSLH